MRCTVQRKDRVPMSSFVVQVSGNLPPHALDHDGGVRRHTVLRATVRDQAALYGLFKMLNDLGLELLALRLLPSSEEAGAASFPEPGAPMTIEVIIRGSIGDLAMTALCDHIEVTHHATRLVLSDGLLLNQVIDWARHAGAAVEYAAESPPPTIPQTG
jgi:hypothetical protein